MKIIKIENHYERKAFIQFLLHLNRNKIELSA